MSESVGYLVSRMASCPVDLAAQDVGEADASIHVEELREIAAAQVGIDEQHARAGGGHGDGEIAGDRWICLRWESRW